MPPLKRHPALQDFSRDHHRFLIEARNVRWALECHEHARPLQDAIASLLVFWQQEGLRHLQEEEEILYPLVFENNLHSQPYLVRVSSDHVWMRIKLKQLQDSQVRDRQLLASISERMTNHIRFEEQVLYEYIQSHLTEAELEMIGERSLAYRQKR